MKKMMIILLAMAVGFTATAQNVHVARPHYRPRVIIGAGASFYPYYGFYSPFYPWPAYSYGYRPSRLELQLQEIKNDYQLMIRDARHDNQLSKEERRMKINSLKHDRDQAVIQAQKDFYTKRNYNR